MRKKVAKQRKQTVEAEPNPIKTPEIDVECQMSEEDDFFIDESLIRLFSILIPKLKWILLFSFAASMFVGIRLYVFTPRQYVCTSIISPDVMRDMNSFDLVQMTSLDSDMIQLPYASQLMQLKTLANSSQVKRQIIQKVGLMKKWKCEDELECLIKLGKVYSVKEIRNVGLELKAKYLDEEIPLLIVDAAIKQTNLYFEESLKAKAIKSVTDIQGWIKSVTEEIKLVSDAYITYASDNNITELESQFSSGIALISTIKSNIVEKESELAVQMASTDENARELLPLKDSIAEYRGMLTALLEGTEKDKVFPPLAQYSRLKFKVDDFQAQLKVLRNRNELFNKQLASAQLEAYKESNTIMVLDEPLIEPSGKGTVKFAVLAFIGLFFMLCIFIVMLEYWKTIREALLEYQKK